MNASLPYATLQRHSDDTAPDLAPQGTAGATPWAGIRLECMNTGTDWGTMGWLLATLEPRGAQDTGWCVSLKIKGRDERLDVRILSVQHIGASDGPESYDGKTGGILVRSADSEGEPVGPPVFVPYVDVEALGVY